MEDKVRQKEAMATASTELEKDPLEDKFAALEKNDDLDRQLADLKSKVQGGGSTGA
jgi:phage shock protein A